MNPLENEGTVPGDHMGLSSDGTGHQMEENNETLTRGVHNPSCPLGANIYPRQVERIHPVDCEDHDDSVSTHLTVQGTCP